jgi:molybdopterin-guanine dinucleotide biosynthesis protein A
MTTSERTAGWLAVVLAGGTSRRWGGGDKTAAPLAGEPVLVHAVSAVARHVAAVVVVAPAEHPARAAVHAAAAGRCVTWTREHPPGSGPAAAVAAGVAALPPGEGPERMIAVLAGDQPFTRAVWPRLGGALAAHPEADAAIGRDPGGRRQPLLAVYREGALRARLAAVAVHGRPLRVIMDGLHVVEVPVGRVEALDLDTPEDAAEAERFVGPAAATEPNQTVN